MTDRELIDLAAKAADIQLVDLLDSYGDLGGLEREGWNPLKNDGEALRLAVKLHIDILQFKYHEGKMYCQVDRMGKAFFENLNENPYTATRRAIVMAAAEIGKAMK